MYNKIVRDEIIILSKQIDKLKMQIKMNKNSLQNSCTHELVAELPFESRTFIDQKRARICMHCAYEEDYWGLGDHILWNLNKRVTIVNFDKFLSYRHLGPLETIEVPV